MHTRRLISFLLGLWFALVLTIGAVTMKSVQIAQQISKTPPGPPSRALVLVGEPMTERIFVFIADEINRTLLETSGLVELAIVFTVACLLFFQNYNRTATILAGVLLLAAFASQFLLTPQLVAQARVLDFRPDEMMLSDRARHANLIRLSGILTVFRLLCGAWITGILLYRGPNSRMRRRGDKIDAIDNSEHSHIDG